MKYYAFFLAFAILLVNFSLGNNYRITDTIIPKERIESDPCAGPLDEKVKLDLGDPVRDDNRFSYSPEELEKYQKEFYSHYYYETKGKQLDHTNTKVRATSLKMLFEKIKNSGKYDCTTDLSAVVMHIGMRDKQLVIIYEPTILKQNLRYANRFDQNPLGVFYIADKEGNLKEIKEEDEGDKEGVRKLLENYRGSKSKIHIVHRKPKKITKFISHRKFRKGDVEDCTMPLQQVFRMYKDNGGSYDMPGKNAIDFTIVASDYFRRSRRNFKTHIIASFNLGAKLREVPDTYSGLGADFSQMSPPKDNIYLPTEQSDIYITKKGKEAKKLESPAKPNR